MFMKSSFVILLLTLLGSTAALAQNMVYPKMAETDEPYGIVEITDFSVGRIPIYNDANGAPVDFILFEKREYENGGFYATSTQNGLKFYPYQIWQGEEAAREAASCEMAENRRYLLQLEVVGDVSGKWLKVATHFAFGCPANIDGTPMYIPYTIDTGAKVPGALDFGEYFLIEYQPELMRLITWAELFMEAEVISNYGGLEVFAAPDGAPLDAAGFGDTLKIIDRPDGVWVRVEGWNGNTGWIKWREGKRLHPQIHALGPSRYDQFDECINAYGN